MKKRILVILVLTFFVKCFSQESILLLMKEYETHSDLSKVTRKESLGHVYVLTRKEMDIMQAYTLADVLKGIPMFHQFPNRYGAYTLLNPGERAGISIKYRLYIDDHEVSSIHTSNPFLTFDHYPLDNINHIEIYYSMGSIAVSNEPAQVIIKMYTKKPERENSSNIRLSKDIRNSYSGNVVIAKQINDNESFLFMVDQSYFDYKSVHINNDMVSRDNTYRSVFFKYKFQDYIFETGYMAVHRDIFTGFSLDSVPDDGNLDSVDFYVYLTRYLLDDKSFKFHVSYDNQKREYTEDNKEGLLFPLKLFNQSNPPIMYSEKRTFDKYSLYIEKKINTRIHHALFGTFIRYYRQKGDKFHVLLKDMSLVKDLFYVKYFRNFSTYFEDIFTPFKNISLIGGVRLDNFKFSNTKTKNKFNYRIGFSTIVKNRLTLKGFISYSYLLPSMYLIENAKDFYLEPMNIKVLTGETKYKIDETSSISFIAQFYKARKHFDFDRVTNSFVNGKDKKFHVFSLLYRWEPDYFNTIEVNYWFTNQGDTSLSPPTGGFIKLFTEFKKIKIYNEITYKSDYKPLFYNFNSSFNYSFSITYHLPEDYYITLKGENLFGNGGRAVRAFPIGFPASYPVYDRKYIISINKIF